MKTKEQEIKMAELLASAEASIQKYNELIVDGKYDAKIEEEIDQAINEYTRIARTVAFDECKASENPMHEACIRLTFETVRAKDVPVEEKSKIKVKEIEPVQKVIDLKKLRKHCDGKLGADIQWIYALEKFNMVLTAQRAKDLGLSPKGISDSYAMADISRQYDLGKNPGAKANMLATLTKIVQMMIGEEYSPDIHDLNFLLSVYSKKGRRALCVSCANHNHMRQYAQEICHRILTGEVYDVDFKRVKK